MRWSVPMTTVLWVVCLSLLSQYSCVANGTTPNTSIALHTRMPNSMPQPATTKTPTQPTTTKKTTTITTRTTTTTMAVKAMTKAISVTYTTDSTRPLIILILLLIFLLLLFFYCCRRLNKETQGAYSFKALRRAGGVAAERVAERVRALEDRLGVQLLPRGGEAEEQGEEEEEEEEEREEESERDVEQGNVDSKDDCSSEDDYSSLEGCDLRERGRQRQEEEEEEEEEGDVRGKEGGGLLVDLKEFSGSAIWEGRGQERDGGGEREDFTAL
ncbi:uncharacterized protein LOC136764473 [Amia ocellicauda]|uniref:uncharacterized protein LOC136764473 n=1 Tax=Amia ocellicauda TaxID=2972642 RepID=UPI003463F4E9